jgi:hypothetical protein
MESIYATRVGTREAADFEGLARAYAAAIEAPSLGARLRQDPELRKHLARIYTAIADARRLHEAESFAGDEATARLHERIGKLDEKDDEEKCEST